MVPRARRPHLSRFVFAVAVVGCAASETDVSSPSMDESSSAASSDVSSAASSDTTLDATTWDAGDEPPASCGDPGVDAVALSDVTLFQTIAVPLARNCAAIDSAERVAPIVAGRVAMVRTSVVLGAAFEAGDLVARVELSSAAGDESFTGTCTPVAAGAGEAELQVEIPAAALNPDTSWSVSVTDCEGAALVGFPEAGLAQLDAQTTGVLRLHLVPFEIGGFVPDTSQAVIDGFRDALLAHYPVTDVEITVGDIEPDDSGGQLDMGGLLVRIVQLQELNAFASGHLDPEIADIYYYGLVTGAATREEFCESCPTGTSEAGGGERAGAAVGAAFADALAESTLVHEVGHLHGLLHAPCGDPPDVDPEFPYADGATHTEGWDVRTGELIPPTHNDLMGYCQPRWVSDYNYRKLVDWVQLASSWNRMRAPAPIMARALTRTQCD